MSAQVLLSSMSAPGIVLPAALPPATRHCRFCLEEGHTREARAVCDWPVEEVIETPWSDLRIGDSWVVRHAGLVGVVRDIDLDPMGGVRFRIAFPGRKELCTYSRWGPWSVFTTRPGGRCSTPCCFRHRRHVGPNRDYCRGHWNSWMEVG